MTQEKLEKLVNEYRDFISSSLIDDAFDLEDKILNEIMLGGFIDNVAEDRRNLYQIIHKNSSIRDIKITLGIDYDKLEEELENEPTQKNLKNADMDLTDKTTIQSLFSFFEKDPNKLTPERIFEICKGLAEYLAVDNTATIETDNHTETDYRKYWVIRK
jgi:fructose-bisphosphate aldolase class 1